MSLAALDQHRHPLSLALDWVARGVPAFPCALSKDGPDAPVKKRPLPRHGHRDASRDPDLVRDMFVQADGALRDGEVLAVGLCPGAGGYVVLDPDVKGEDSGVAYAAKISLPMGWLVVTASGGQHRWFRKPDPAARYANVTPPDWKGLIDIRADHGWVVAPGTITDLGSWVPSQPWPEDGPPVAPASVAQYLTAAGPDQASDETRVGRLDDEKRALLEPKTLEVLDWLLGLGAHSPALFRRDASDRYFVGVTRPGKRDGNSANVGHAADGALHLFSTSWKIPLPGAEDGEEVPAGTTCYPYGRGEPDLLGARLATPAEGAGALAAPGGDLPFFAAKIGLLTVNVVRALVADGLVAMDPYRNLWHYEDGVWCPDVGGDEVLAGKMFGLLGNRHRSTYVRSVAQGVRAVAQRIAPDEPGDRWLNCPNGMLDWRTGEVVGHAPEFQSVNRLPVAWNPDATCPAFDAWAESTFEPELLDPIYDGASFIDMVLGYLVVPGNRFQIAFLTLGSGSNGKSLFLKVAVALLGKDNVSAVALRDLDENRFKAASLYGRLANISGDTGTRRLDDTDTFKKITGGDLVSAEHKYGATFEFRSYAVPVFNANEVFGTPDTSDGYFRRWLVLPFNRTFKGTDADPALEDNLRTSDELEGLLVRAVRGARALDPMRAFPAPAPVAEAVEQFKRESDPVRAFLSDCTRRDPDGWVARTELYGLYERWCSTNGHGALSSSKFYAKMRQAGYAERQGRGVTAGKRGLAGLACTVTWSYAEASLVPVVGLDALSGLVDGE